MKAKAIASLLASVAAQTVSDIVVTENFFCEDTVFTIAETAGNMPLTSCFEEQFADYSTVIVFLHGASGTGQESS